MVSHAAAKAHHHMAQKGTAVEQMSCKLNRARTIVMTRGMAGVGYDRGGSVVCGEDAW
jgi:hypothetical protein